VKWTLASSTGRDRDKDRRHDARGRREVGGSRLADSLARRACARVGRTRSHGPLARGPYRLNSSLNQHKI
jgi:hypothetical protein